MLTQYLNRTKRLLQNPGAPAALYSDADLTDYINQARGQLAGDAECIRNRMTRVLAIGSPGPYPFISLVVSFAVVGIAGALHARQITIPVAGGSQILNARPWEWFEQYYVATQTPANGTPTDWAQYNPGTKGELFVFPQPATAVQISVDCVCYPVDLTTDTTAEAIPYPFTDAVPYFAAYLALLAAQAGARDAQALRMLSLYEEFKTRARKYSTPSVLPQNYEQSSPQVPVLPLSPPMAKRA